MVCGPPGAGKTTLAQALAARVGGPAICRDELKEGLVATLGRVPTAEEHEALNLQALDVFFTLLADLTAARVSTVAEAAYQDRLWRPGLEPLLSRARLVVLRCRVPAELAHARHLARRVDPRRRAHADDTVVAGDERPFDWPRLDVPTLDVNTADDPQAAVQLAAAFVLDHRNTT